MIKVRLVCIFFFLFFGNAFADPATIKTDSLTAILKNKDIAIKKRELIMYLRYSFGDMPKKDLKQARAKTAQILRSNHEPDSEGLMLFVDGICRLREKDYPGAQNSFLKAVEEADQNE